MSTPNPFSDPNFGAVAPSSNPFSDPDFGKPRSAAGEITNQLKAGAVVDLPRMIGKAVRAAAPTGSSVGEWAQRVALAAEKRGQRPDLQPQPEAHGAVVNALASGARMIPQSVAPAAVAGTALAALPIELPAAAVLGGAAALGSLPAALSTGQDTFERGREAGLSESDARAAAIKTGAIEGAGETIGTFAGGKLLGIAGKALKGPASQSLKAATGQSVLRPFLRQLPKTAATEVGTEVGQNAAQAAVENQAGISDVSPLDAGAEVIGPTLGMTALLAPFGLAGFGAAAQGKQRRATLLSDAESPVTRRTAAAKAIADELRESDPQAAQNFLEHAGAAISNRAALPISDELLAPYRPQQALPAPVIAAPDGSIASEGGSEAGQREAALQDAADQFYSERDQEARRRELAMASTGIDVGEIAPENVTLTDARPAPGDEPPSTEGLIVGEPDTVTLSERQDFVDQPDAVGIDVGVPDVEQIPQQTGDAVERSRLDDLRQLQALTDSPEAKAVIGEEIAAEEARARKQAATEDKQRRAVAAADELRRIAERSSDASVRATLIARADKIAPPPAQQDPIRANAAPIAAAAARPDAGPITRALGAALGAQGDRDVQQRSATVAVGSGARGGGDVLGGAQGPVVDRNPDRQAAADNGGSGFGAAAPVSVATAEPQRDASLTSQDGDWTAFPAESGTLGVPRAQMPQIKAEHRGAMVNYLSARGIRHQQATVAPDTLKATQTEFSAKKVAKAISHQGGDRSILVSSDGYVVDGHHQWLAALHQNKPIGIIQLDAPVSALLPALREFPSSTTAAGSTQAQVSPEAQLPKAVALSESPAPGEPVGVSAREDGGVSVPQNGDANETPAAGKGNVDARLGAAPFRVARVSGIESALTRRFGTGVRSLQKAEILNIVQSFSDLPADVQQQINESLSDPSIGVDAVVRGAYLNDAGKAYLIADLISEDQAPSLLLHEVGEHYGLQRMLGADAYARLIEETRAAKDRLPAVRDAWATVKSNYGHLKEGDDAFVREVIAHVGESADAIRFGWFKSMLQAIRQFLWRNGYKLRLTDDDLRAMVVRSLRKAMRSSRRSDAASSSGVLTSRTESTKAGYENRIDALFSGARAKRPGVRVLDRSDMLGLLGLGDRPLVLQESKVNVEKHDMTAADWKKVPEWLENPAAVFDSHHEGRLVFIGPELVNGASVRMIVEPGENGQLNLLVNAFDAHGRQPYMEWTRDQRLRYLQETKGPSQTGRSKPYLAGLPESARASVDLQTDDRTGLKLPVDVRQLRGYKSKVLTQADLVKYRADRGGASRVDYSLTASAALPGPFVGTSPQREALAKAGLAFDDRTVAERARDGLSESLGLFTADTAKRIEEGLFNRFLPLREAERGRRLTAAESPYVAARLSTGSGSTTTALLTLGQGEWRDGVIQKRRGTSGLLDVLRPVQGDIDAWAAWMVAKRAEYLAGQGKERNLSAEDIAALKNMAAGREAVFEDVAKRVREFHNSVLEIARGAGLLSEDQVSAFKRDRYYIPFYRVDNHDPNAAAMPFVKRGLSHQSSGIKKLKGGRQALNDPIQNMLANITRLVDASLKNNAALKAVQNIPESFVELGPQDEKAGAVRVMDNGSPRWFKAEPAMMRAMAGFTPDRWPEGLAPFRTMKRLLTSGVTADPGFVIRNFIRDVIYSVGVSRDKMTPLVSSISGVRSALRMDEDTQAIMFAGASFLGGGQFGGSSDTAAQSLRRAMAKKGFPKSAAETLAIGPRFWQMYRELGEAVENSNRIAVFKAARAGGKSVAEAVYESKDLMDYSLQGSWTAVRLLADVVPFFNARLQGLYRLGRAANNQQLYFTGGAIAAASAALLLANADDDRWKALTDEDKDLFWHVFVGDLHYRIPKPFEIGILFGTVPERIGMAMIGEDAKLGRRALWAFSETFAMDPTPQLVKPALEAFFNYDTFRRAPIEGMSDEGKLPQARYDTRTSEFMRWMGEGLEMSPKKLEHLWNGYLGTLGGYILSAVDGLIRWGQPGAAPAPKLRDYPVLGSFVRSADPTAARYSREMYDTLKQAEQVYRTARAYQLEGRIEDAHRLIEDNKDLLAKRKMLSNARTQIGKMRKQADAVKRNADLSADEKRRELDAIERRVYQLAKRVVEAAA
jgi:hypothetical protein